MAAVSAPIARVGRVRGAAVGLCAGSGVGGGLGDSAHHGRSIKHVVIGPAALFCIDWAGEALQLIHPCRIGPWRTHAIRHFKRAASRPVRLGGRTDTRAGRWCSTPPRASDPPCRLTDYLQPLPCARVAFLLVWAGGTGMCWCAPVGQCMAWPHVGLTSSITLASPFSSALLVAWHCIGIEVHFVGTALPCARVNQALYKCVPMETFPEDVCMAFQGLVLFRTPSCTIRPPSPSGRAGAPLMLVRSRTCGGTHVSTPRPRRFVCLHG